MRFNSFERMFRLCPGFNASKTEKMFRHSVLQLPVHLSIVRKDDSLRF